MTGVAGRSHRHPGRAPGVVAAASRRARPARASLGEDRPLDPRLRPAGPPRPPLGHREPDEPLLPHARTQGRALLRGGAPGPLRVPRDPGRQSRRRLSLREVQGAPARAVRAGGRPLSAEPRREPPDPGAGGARQAPPAGASSSRTWADRARASCASTRRPSSSRWLDRLDLGPDGTALVQEYLEPVEGAIVRVEVLGASTSTRSASCAMRRPGSICARPTSARCPSGAAAPPDDLGACPVSAAGGPDGHPVRRARPEAIETVIRLARAASIDVGGVEYLVSKADGRIYYYDVNATSNFVANAEAVVGLRPDRALRRLHRAPGPPRGPGGRGLDNRAVLARRRVAASSGATTGGLSS